MRSLFRAICSIALVCPLMCLACASSDENAQDLGDGGSAGSGKPNGIPSAFSWFCIGTLKVEKNLMLPSGPGAWGSDSDNKASAGTAFLVGTAYHKWEGYIIHPDGTPAKIESDFSTGLEIDTDFSSDCALAYKQAEGVYVLLAKASFYETDKLTGTACTLEAGTMLSNYAFQSGTTSSEVSSEEIKAKCGLETAYTNDMIYGQLISR